MKSGIMLTAALGILSLAGAVPASASSSHSHYTEPFTLTGGPSPACPMLPTGFVISGSIDGFQVVNTSFTNDGVEHVEVNSVELGSATDSNGATYVINYHNHQSAAIPPGGFPFTVLINDHFNLVGNGLATQVTMHFVIRVTFLSSSDPGTVQVVNVHGDPFDCDVI